MEQTDARERDGSTGTNAARVAPLVRLAPLDKTTSYLTAFDSPLGRLEWLCLPMGLQPSAPWPCRCCAAAAAACCREEATRSARHPSLY
eukprot:COSAG02_NODE_21398_length_789_cov_2.708696_2_plen_89_part_00